MGEWWRISLTTDLGPGVVVCFDSLVRDAQMSRLRKKLFASIRAFPLCL